MGDFDGEDDFSDLYAEVEVQASSAISAMHGLSRIPPANGGDFRINDGYPQLAGKEVGVFENGNKFKEEEEEENVIGKTESAVGYGGSYGHATGVEEAGKHEEGCGALNNVIGDGNKHEFVDNYDIRSNGNCGNGIEVRVKNARSDEGKGVEEEEEKEGGRGSERNLNTRGCHSQRKYTMPASVAVSDNLKGNGSVGTDWEDNEHGRLTDGRRGSNISRSQSSKGSRQTPACKPVSLDLEKYGTVQISDSEEDDHHELSESDSDGLAEVTEAPDDTNRRKLSSKSNEMTSSVDPEFSSSSGPHAAVSDDYMRRRHNHSESTSVSSVSKSWKLTTRGYHTSKDSENHCVKRDTRDGGYYERDISPRVKSYKHSQKSLKSFDSQVPESLTCNYSPSKITKGHDVKPNFRHNRYYCERGRDPIRKKLKLPGRLNHLSNLKNLSREDAYGIDVRGSYDMHRSKTGHGKHAFLNSSEKDMRYSNRSNGCSTYLRDSYPNYRSVPAYLKKQDWKVHPGHGREAEGRDGYNVSENPNFLKRRRADVNYEDQEHDRYQNERRHTGQNMDHLKFESRKPIPRYTHPMNGRITEFSEKGDDDMQFRRGKQDDLPLHSEYNNNFVERKDRRCVLNGDKKGDYLCHIYDRKMSHDRRDMESPRRDTIMYDIPFNSFDNTRYIDPVDNDRRYIKHQPTPFRSYERPHLSSRAWFHGAAEPKCHAYQGPVRNTRCSWGERYEEIDRYGSVDATFDASEGPGFHPADDHFAERRPYWQSSITSNTNQSIKNHQNDDRFMRRRNHLQSETLHLKEEEYKSTRRDEIMFHSEGPLDHHSIWEDRMPGNRHTTVRVAKVINERKPDGGRYKLKGYGDCNNQFDQRSKFVHPDSRVQMHQRYRDSADPSLVLEQKKCTTLSSRRTSGAGDAIQSSTFMERNVDRDPEGFKEATAVNRERVVSTDDRKVATNQFDENPHNKFSNYQQNVSLDIEEGQIVGEEVNKMPIDHDTAQPEPAPNVIRIATGLDDQKIQEIMTKMERRRERFKDPITLNKDSGKISRSLSNLDDKTDIAEKLVRPSRKRKWL